MATTITGKLNKAANEFQAGAYTGFGIRLGKQYYDRETKQKEWTNYEAAVFSNNTQQIEFFRSNLVEGAVIEITAESEKIKQFQGNNGLVLSIELLDCKLGYVHSGHKQGQQQYAPQQAPQQTPQHQQYAPQQAPQQPYTGQPQAPNNGYAQAQNGAPQGNFNQPQR
jgi:hypothetical protein